MIYDMQINHNPLTWVLPLCASPHGVLVRTLLSGRLLCLMTGKCLRGLGIETVW